MADSLLVDIKGPIATLTLNRPDKHNAFDGTVVEGLLEALESCAQNDDVRVIVLAGAGKSFCAGADLRWMASLGASADNNRGARVMAGLFGKINDSPKPVIARIHGAVRGGGVGIVAACDMAVALDTVTFQFSEVRLGLAPAVISPYVIARIGTPAAREFFVTGDKFDARRAFQLCLVSRVVEDTEELDAAIVAYATSIAKGGPRAVAACKELAVKIPSLGATEAFDYTAGLIAELRASAEGQEGMRSFIERRKPNWQAGN